MKPIRYLVASVFCGVAIAAASASPQPVVSQLHVLSIHVPDHAAFDAVFELLGSTLELPRVYGKPSKPDDQGRRLYAGFSVGNAYLEPCGPYSTDAPFTTNQPARFHGLTFSPASAIDDDAEELTRRGISHWGVSKGGGKMPRFLYCNDALLHGKRLSVGLWEIQDKQDCVNLNFVGAALREARGGSLGVQRMQEVRIGCAGKSNLEAWARFLSPVRREGDVWFVGDGPALRLVFSTENRVEAIVLQVESLEKAKAVLVQRQLLGKLVPEGIELNPAKTFGLQILLKGK